MRLEIEIVQVREENGPDKRLVIREEEERCCSCQETYDTREGQLLLLRET